MASSPIPSPGEWPVDPQEDVPISKDRIWVDGCFDFTHHGVYTCMPMYLGSANNVQGMPEPCFKLVD